MFMTTYCTHVTCIHELGRPRRFLTSSAPRACSPRLCQCSQCPSFLPPAQSTCPRWHSLLSCRPSPPDHRPWGPMCEERDRGRPASRTMSKMVSRGLQLVLLALLLLRDQDCKDWCHSGHRPVTADRRLQPKQVEFNRNKLSFSGQTGTELVTGLDPTDKRVSFFWKKLSFRDARTHYIMGPRRLLTD